MKAKSTCPHYGDVGPSSPASPKS